MYSLITADSKITVPSTIKSAKEKLKLPIVGIGGITFENQELAFEAGCDAVAMLNGLFS